ncbi:hypothetical protein [Brevibacillus formosus]
MRFGACDGHGKPFVKKPTYIDEKDKK